MNNLMTKPNQGTKSSRIVRGSHFNRHIGKHLFILFIEPMRNDASVAGFGSAKKGEHVSLHFLLIVVPFPFLPAGWADCLRLSIGKPPNNRCRGPWQDRRWNLYEP